MENNNYSTEKAVITWIKSHPFFKYAAMCAEVGIDRSNFSRTLYTGLPHIKESVLKKIVKIISKYGFVDAVETAAPIKKVKSAKGLPPPKDFVEAKNIALLHPNGKVEKLELPPGS